MRTLRTCTLALLGIATPLSAIASSDSLDEARAYGIQHYRGTTVAPPECDHKKDSGWYASADGYPAAYNWYFDMLATAGSWDAVDEYQDVSAGGNHFTDYYKDPSGRDDASGGIDEVDLAYVITHGSNKNGKVGLLMGNGYQDCRTNSREDWRFGDGAVGELYALSSGACTVGSYNAFLDRAFAGDVAPTSSTFTVMNGFHGLNSGNMDEWSALVLYPVFSLYDGMGDNWIDLMHKDSASADKDRCPTTRVMGNSTSDVDDAYWYAGAFDRLSTGNKTMERMYWLSGCDARHGDVLP